MTLQQKLRELSACSDARLWVGDKTLTEAWETCPHADWMLWFAEKVGVDRLLLISAATECAATVLPLMKDIRSQSAIATYRLYVKGEASEQEFKAAANDACFAYKYADPSRFEYYAAARTAFYAAKSNCVYEVAVSAANAAGGGYYTDATYAHSAACASIVRGIIKLDNLNL